MLEGKKTYIGLVIIVLGWLGIGGIISESDVTIVVDNIIQLVGIVIAVYGRYMTNKG